MAARRQINVATGHHAPLWLSEGFAAYGDHAVHKVNRWFSVYSPEQAPPTGDWVADARRLAGEAKLKRWSDIAKLEQRDWQAHDYVQMLGMTTFLLESEPANQGFVVATNPLSETGWHQFQPGQLVVFDHGRLAYSSSATASGGGV